VSLRFSCAASDINYVPSKWLDLFRKDSEGLREERGASLFISSLTQTTNGGFGASSFSLPGSELFAIFLIRFVS
jgi:hypothetical protein